MELKISNMSRSCSLPCAKVQRKVARIKFQGSCSILENNMATHKTDNKLCQRTTLVHCCNRLSVGMMIVNTKSQYQIQRSSRWALN